LRGNPQKNDSYEEISQSNGNNLLAGEELE
jgi:hypothetical protein